MRLRHCQPDSVVDIAHPEACISQILDGGLHAPLRHRTRKHDFAISEFDSDLAGVNVSRARQPVADILADARVSACVPFGSDG